MNFYRRRPLAAAISLCIAVSAAAAFLPATAKLAVIAAVLTAVIVLPLILRRREKLSLFNIPAAVFVILCGALILCILLTSFAYFNVYAARYTGLESAEIRAVVTEVKAQNSYSGLYKIRLVSVDGAEDRGGGLLLDESGTSFALGDVIRVRAEFCDIKDVYDYGDTARFSVFADGCVFACRTEGKADVVGICNDVDVRLAKLRDTLCAKLSLYLDRDSAAFSKALMLGERDALGRVRRDFNYLGITHILALSGLHLAVMTGAVENMLLRLKMRRRLRILCIILTVGLYVVLTGFLMSVVRAALMLAISYGASFISTDNDRVTSLFFAVWVILLISPAALFDISLQLSFMATLGVILLRESAEGIIPSGKYRNHFVKGFIRSLKALLMNIYASIGAVLFVLPLQWLYFKEISAVSVPATVIMAFLCEGLLILLLPYLIFSAAGVGAVCQFLSVPVMFMCNACSAAAEWLSPGARLISLKYPFALPIIIGLVAVLVWMMRKDFSSWAYSLIPLFAACAVFGVCAFGYHFVHTDDVSVDYLNDRKHDALLTVSRRHAMVIDATNGSKASMVDVRYALADRCLTEIDVLMLTDIKRGHTGAVRALLQCRVVHRILLPIPADEYENFLLEDMRQAAREYGAEVILYSPYSENTVTFGDVKLSVPKRTFIERSLTPISALGIEVGNTKVAYAGASSWEDDYIWSFTEDADCLIIGENGPTLKTPPIGNIPDSVKHLCVANEDRVGFLSEWIFEYLGTLSCGPVHRINIEG